MAKRNESKSEGQWDVESAVVVRPTNRSERVVFSVQFSREEFDEVSRQAKAAGLKPGVYIRNIVANYHPQPELGTQVSGGVVDGNVQLLFVGSLAGSMTQPTDEFVMVG